MNEGNKKLVDLVVEKADIKRRKGLILNVTKVAITKAEEYTRLYEKHYCEGNHISGDSLECRMSAVLQLPVNNPVTNRKDEKLLRNVIYDCDENRLYAINHYTGEVMPLDEIMYIPKRFMTVYREDFSNAYKDDMKIVGINIKSIKLVDDNTPTVSELDKEVLRIANKYKERNEELEVIGEHPKECLHNKCCTKRDSRRTSEEEIVNILKDL